MVQAGTLAQNDSTKDTYSQNDAGENADEFQHGQQFRVSGEIGQKIIDVFHNDLRKETAAENRRLSVFK